MGLLFVSHSSEDDESAARVARRLEDAGFRALFLDFDPEAGIPAGRDWERELYRRLGQADAVVFLASPASARSRWCFAELALARAWRVPVFPVLVDGPRHSLLADVQWVDFAAHGDAALERLVDALRLHGLDPERSFAWDPARPPYPGLRPFQPEEAAVFFGREREVDELLERLRPALRRRHASLAVVGPSGSGKSSLVRAGLLPRLRRQPAEWAVIRPFVPGDRPLTALARALGRDLPERPDAGELERRLRASPALLIDLARDLAEGDGIDGRLVLMVIDQAEELVTLASDDACAEFVELVAPAVSAPGPLRVLLTLRSEFMSGMLQRPGMADLVGDWIAVGPLDRARLPAVVTGPARRAGVEYEDGLVERLVDDAHGGDALPLLAFTLRQLHDRAHGGVISHAIYDAGEGVLGALRAQADALLDDLERRGLGALVLPTLLRLVTLGERDEPTARRLARDSLTADEGEVADRFVDAHLLVSDAVDGEPVVAVSHEALLRGWPPLAEAIDAERENLRQRAQLERAALDWDRSGRQAAYELASARLLAAERWAEAHHEELARLPLLSALMRASAESDASARARVAESLAQRVLDGFDDDPELAAPLAVAAIERLGPAHALVEALRAALRRSRLRAAWRSGGPITCVAWAPDGARAVTGGADGAVRLWDPRDDGAPIALADTGGAVVALGFSPDGGEVAVSSDEHPETVRVLDLRTRAERLVLRGSSYSGAASVCFTPDGRGIAMRGNTGMTIRSAADGGDLDLIAGIGPVFAFSPGGDRVLSFGASASRPAVHSTADGAREIDLGGFEATAALSDADQPGAAWSPDGSRLAVALEERGWVWDAASGRLVARLTAAGAIASPAGRARSRATVSFTADTMRVVTVFRDGVPRLWDATDGRELLALREHGAPATAAAFAPRGERVLTGAASGAVRVWDLADDHDAEPGPDGLLYALTGDGDGLTCAAFSPDGTRIVVGSAGGAARVWEVGARGGREVATLAGHGDAVTAATYAPDGALILTASYDGQLRLWPADGGASPRVIEGPRGAGRAAGAPALFTSAVFFPGGDLVLAGLRDATARVWELAGETIRIGFGEHSGPVTCVAVAPDGGRCASGSWEHMFSTNVHGTATARLWDATTRRELLRLDHRARVLAVAFSPDGARLATGAEDGAARVWDAATGAELLAIREHGAAVRSVAFSPDGSRLLTASDDATARVWDVVDGRERFVFAGHGGPVTCAAFAPDGSRIVTASDDGVARVWRETGVEELLRLAHRRVRRRLTRDELRRFGLAERSDDAPRFRVADLPEA